MDAQMIMWGVLIIVFTILEAVTLGLTSIWFAVGSLAALIAAGLGFKLPVQIIVFIVIVIVLLLYTRPIAKKYLKIGANKTNIDALIGQVGSVTKEIPAMEIGQVKLNGQIWTAKSADGNSILLDEKVEVIAIEGVKLIVKTIDNIKI